MRKLASRRMSLLAVGASVLGVLAIGLLGVAPAHATESGVDLYVDNSLPVPERDVFLDDGGPAVFHFDISNKGDTASPADTALSFAWNDPVGPPMPGSIDGVTATGPHAPGCAVDLSTSTAHCAIGSVPPGGLTDVTFVGTADAQGFAHASRAWVVHVTSSATTDPSANNTEASVWRIDAPMPSTTPVAKPTVDRIGGADRYETSVDLARSAYPETAPVVFLASGVDFPDALSGGAAAAHEGGPLLLTDPNGLPTAVAAELAALRPARIVIVGGPAAISASVEHEAAASVPTAHVDRLAGADRYATSEAVVADAYHGQHPDTAWIATGASFPDALSAASGAGAHGQPLILVPGAAASLPTATTSFIAGLGVTTVDIAGGLDAVSSGVEASIDERFGADGWSRWFGADRFISSEWIGIHEFLPTNAVGGEHPIPLAFLASGTGFADALAGSAVAGSEGAPLFVTRSSCVPLPVLAGLADFPPAHVTIIGGPSALADPVASLTSC